MTKTVAWSVRVNEATYKALLAIKHKLERKEHRRVPIGDAVRELLNSQKED